MGLEYIWESLRSTTSFIPWGAWFKFLVEGEEGIREFELESGDKGGVGGEFSWDLLGEVFGEVMEDGDRGA